MYPRFQATTIASALCVAVSCGSLNLSAADTSSYSDKQLTIKKAELTDAGKVQIIFRTMPETLYYCPGANETRAGDKTVLTFVRTFFKLKPKVKYQAKTTWDPAKAADKQILVEAKGKPLFIKAGDKFVKIYPVD